MFNISKGNGTDGMRPIDHLARLLACWDSFEVLSIYSSGLDLYLLFEKIIISIHKDGKTYIPWHGKYRFR